MKFILSEKEYQILSLYLPKILNFDFSGGIEDLGDIDYLSIPSDNDLIEKIKFLLEDKKILRSYEFSLDLIEDIENLISEIKKNFKGIKINLIKMEYLEIFSDKIKKYYSLEIISEKYQDRENLYNFLNSLIG